MQQIAKTILKIKRSSIIITAVIKSVEAAYYGMKTEIA